MGTITTDELSARIKKITKPLYETKKPVYSIRISESAWEDLKHSVWFRDFDGDLSTKW